MIRKKKKVGQGFRNQDMNNSRAVGHKGKGYMVEGYKWAKRVETRAQDGMVMINKTMPFNYRVGGLKLNDDHYRQNYADMICNTNVIKLK